MKFAPAPFPGKIHPVPSPSQPFLPDQFRQMGVVAAWQKYRDRLSWGRGQTLAILDDGCDLTIPEWQGSLPWGDPKVVGTWNAVENHADPTPAPGHLHGTSVGFASSLNHQGIGGIAFNNQVAHVRCVTSVHIEDLEVEKQCVLRALEWVREHRVRLNITAVNLAPVDDIEHPEPVCSLIDPILAELRAAGVWVSAPCGNNGWTRGYSWPAMSPFCFGIGATDVTGSARRKNCRTSLTAIFAPAEATSSSNAEVVGCAMVLREAMEKWGFDWRSQGATLPEAIMAVLIETGTKGSDPLLGHTISSAHLLNALDFVRSSAGRKENSRRFPEGNLGTSP